MERNAASAKSIHNKRDICRSSRDLFGSSVEKANVDWGEVSGFRGEKGLKL